MLHVQHCSHGHSGSQPNGGLHLNMFFNEHTGEKGFVKVCSISLSFQLEVSHVTPFTAHVTQCHLIQRELRMGNFIVFPEGIKNRIFVTSSDDYLSFWLNTSHPMKVPQSSNFCFSSKMFIGYFSSVSKFIFQNFTRLHLLINCSYNHYFWGSRTISFA